MKITRKQIIFNEEDEHQRELLEWVASQTSNFSGFIKHVLVAYRSGGAAPRITATTQPAIASVDRIGDIFGLD